MTEITRAVPADQIDRKDLHAMGFLKEAYGALDCRERDSRSEPGPELRYAGGAHLVIDTMEDSGPPL